ncbi:MAG: c-type cytochrome biogenesis protein CcmI [Alphaproteobacteria bacterium]|nr:c-type cytochrome biogenesis protein CcmI [Alphaproteobacteria bacterium]
MIWVVFAAVSMVALVLVARPLTRRNQAPVSQLGPDIAVYQAQLADLEHDIERGLVGQDDADGARREISLRLLATQASEEKSSAPATTQPPKKTLAALLIVALPLCALGIYLLSGAPNLPSQPAGDPREAETRPLAPAAAERLAELRAAAEDGAATALAELGRFYLRQMHYASAADIFAQARETVPLGPDHAALAALEGEALTYLSRGFVSQPALEAFRAALAAEPGEPRARYYMGVFIQQSGRSQEALEMWAALAAESQVGDVWMEAVVRRVVRVAEELDVDPADYLPAHSVVMLGGEAAQAAMVELDDDERAAVIGSMVDRLAARLEANPDDVQGWLRLARSNMVLGKPTLAAEAFARADPLIGEDQVPFLVDWATVLIQSASRPTELPLQLSAVMTRVLAIDPDHADALWFVGVVASQGGDFDTAILHWRHLLEILPQDADVRPVVANAIISIGGSP